MAETLMKLKIKFDIRRSLGCEVTIAPSGTVRFRCHSQSILEMSTLPNTKVGGRGTRIWSVRKGMAQRSMPVLTNDFLQNHKIT